MVRWHFLRLLCVESSEGSPRKGGLESFTSAIWCTMRRLIVTHNALANVPPLCAPNTASLSHDLASLTILLKWSLAMMWGLTQVHHCPGVMCHPIDTLLCCSKPCKSLRELLASCKIPQRLDWISFTGLCNVVICSKSSNMCKCMAQLRVVPGVAFWKSRQWLHWLDTRVAERQNFFTKKFLLILLLVILLEVAPGVAFWKSEKWLDTWVAGCQNFYTKKILKWAFMPLLILFYLYYSEQPLLYFDNLSRS